MNFAVPEECNALIGALEKLLAQAEATAQAVDGSRSFFTGALDAALEEAGFLDAAGLEEFGPIAAAMVVQEISSKPVIVEAAHSSFVRALALPDWPRPIAVLTGKFDQATRFLGVARSVVLLGENHARACRIEGEDTIATEPFFAYPMARLADPAACLARSEVVADAALVRRLLLVATACELSGVLKGALFSVNEYVKNRRQFGRALGSFQAVQHRLAMCASTIAAGEWLARRAAVSDSMEDAVMAAGYLQESTSRILYDLHQFMGAMGLTLEHPLYRWSYRAKLLVSDLGGASRQLRDVAAIAWPETA